MAQQERRAAPRIGPVVGLTARFRATGATYPLVDLSAGGFAIETSFAFSPSTLTTFEFLLPTGTRVSLGARLVHAEPDPHRDPAVHRAGFAFTPAGHQDQRAIWMIVDAARAAARLRGGFSY